MSILEMSLSGGAMILVAALVRLMAGDRLPRRGCVALWALSVVRLLIPAAIPSRLSALGLLVRAGTGAGASGGAAREETVRPVLTVLWLAGSAVLAAAYLVSYLRCVRAFRTSLPAENEAVDRCLREYPLRRRVSVRTLTGLRTPLTYGVLSPVILLPEAAEGWDGERVRMVLWHELTHIRRFDGALKLLAAAALCLHWWNPAVWLMVTLLGRDMELACDSAVAERLDPGRRAEYARLLIDLKAEGGVPPLVVGLGKSVTERRVRSILSHRKASRTAVCASVLLAAAIAAVFATTPLRASPGAVPDTSPQAGSVAQAPGTVTQKDLSRAPEPAPSHLPAFRDEEDGPAPAEHPIETEPFPELEEADTFVIPVLPDGGR